MSSLLAVTIQYYLKFNPNRIMYNNDHFSVGWSYTVIYWISRFSKPISAYWESIRYTHTLTTNGRAKSSKMLSGLHYGYRCTILLIITTEVERLDWRNERNKFLNVNRGTKYERKNEIKTNAAYIMPIVLGPWT